MKAFAAVSLLRASRRAWDVTFSSTKPIGPARQPFPPWPRPPRRQFALNAAFATLERERPDTSFVAADAFFVSRVVQFATLAARDRIPATYVLRDYVAAGGCPVFVSRNH